MTVSEPVKDHDLAGFGLACWVCVVTDDEGKAGNFYGTTPKQAEERARAYVIEPGHADWRDLHHVPRKPL